MSKIIGVTVGTPTSPSRIAQEILPKVTEADNGKFLMVVNGEIKAVALTDVSVEGA